MSAVSHDLLSRIVFSRLFIFSEEYVVSRLNYSPPLLTSPALDGVF